MSASVSVPRVAVVGAGISGLAAAHRIVELAPQCHLTVLEARDQIGGVLQTVHTQGYQIELSADNFITTVPWGVELCQRLGLTDQFVQTNPTYRRTFVVYRGRLCPLPEGFLMLAPTRWWPMVVTPLLNPWGKLRAALEYFLPARRTETDESVASFARRRLGQQAYERLVEPLVSAVYGADLEKLSLQATLARFSQMEQQYGSLIRAMRAQRKLRSGSSQSTGSTTSTQAGSESGARYSMFVTLRSGLSSLVQALADRLPEGAVRLHTPVEHLVRAPDGSWKLVLGGQAANTTETFDAVILALPAHASARILEPLDPELAQVLASIPYTGTAIVAVAFDQTQVGHPLDGMGAVIPAIEHSPILAISFANRKYPHRAPEGKVLLKAFVGGAKHPELLRLDDQQLRELVLAELRRLLHIQGAPCTELVARWPDSMPQYPVGHKERVAQIRQYLARWPHLALAGNAYQGIGLPDCIHTAQQAAETLLAKLQTA